jgi:rubrerythrin
MNAGFKEVYSMEGGINAWDGVVAVGPLGLGMAYFADKNKPEEIIGIAWLLEEGAQRFYKDIAEMFDDKESVQLFNALGADEVRHKQVLMQLFRDLPEYETSSELPWSFTSEALDDVMEGGMHIDEALTQAKGKNIVEILEYSIALETNAYDLYIKMERTIHEQASKTVFKTLLNEEKTHLDRLITLLEKRR